MFRITKVGVAAGAIAFSLAGNAHSLAEGFPAQGKTISIVVPSDAGGGNDLLARRIAPLLAAQLGGKVEVINRPGGGAQVGLTYCASAKPDGYTLCTAGLPSINSTYMIPDRNAPYNKDSFAIIGAYSEDAASVIVPKDSKYKSWDDFIHAAKANPGTLSIGNAGRFSGTHLATVAFEKLTGTNFLPVFFSGGAPAITALLGGHIDAVISTPTNYMHLLKAGDVRVLALMSPAPDERIQGVSTLHQLGYGQDGASADFVFTQVLFTQSGVPQDVLDKVRKALKEVAGQASFASEIGALGVNPIYADSEETSAIWARYDALVKDVVAVAPPEPAKK